MAYAGAEARYQVSNTLAQLRATLGAAKFRDSLAVRALYSQDVYRCGTTPLAVVSPTTVDEVVTAVRAATAANVAIFVRGGGMSYTDAYLPDRERAIVLDLSRLNRVLSISVEDLHATVEAGCTWADLDTALAPHGLRAVFWGPMSGKLATVGGGMSQGAATFGSGRHGTSAAAALSFQLVLASGEILETSASAHDGQAAFFRNYGPDLTALFTGDAGALGVKTAVTLQLEPRPGHGDGLTFAFADFAALRQAVSRVAREGLATEVFGLEGALARFVAGDQSAEEAVKAWLAAGRAQAGALQAVKQMSRIAWHGKRFLAGSPYLANFLTEARDGAALRTALDAIRQSVGDDGLEIANTMAAVTRATPFPAPMLLGPEGLRLLPLHGIFAPSQVEAFHNAFRAWCDTHRSHCDRLGIKVYTVFASCGASAFLYEPVIYWPDVWPALHRETMPAQMLAAWREPAANPDARALVETMRLEIIELMKQSGAAHLQIGRAYPYLQDRDPIFLALLSAVKRAVDPHGLINPGALGLRPD